MFNEITIESIQGLSLSSFPPNGYYLVDTNNIVREDIDRLSIFHLHPSEIKELCHRKNLDAKKAFIASRYLIKSLICQKHGLSITSVQVKFKESTKALVVMDNGKQLPYYISLSHSKNIILLSFYEGQHRIGVDIEYHKVTRDYLSLAECFFSRNDVNQLVEAVDKSSVFYRLWTQKEAYAKMTKQSVSAVLAKDVIEHSTNAWFYSSQYKDYSLTICSNQYIPKLSVKLLPLESYIHS